MTLEADARVAEPHSAPSFDASGTTAIEDGFAFDALSDVAEVESWRKEVYRPVYHQHKWWAQRLGSVFRAAIIGATAPAGAAIMDLFYQPVQLPETVIFDPFMGSGTTVGEAHKLGCTAIGRDINPVAYRAARAALERVDRTRLLELFTQLERTVAPQILALYASTTSDGEPCTGLYYFWVKELPCPGCNAPVDLFSSYVFARHAYPSRYPVVQVLCPACGGLFTGHHDEKQSNCPHCRAQFDCSVGPAKRTAAECGACGAAFPIAETARQAGKPPEHRLYAKLVLKADGSKEYLPATDEDRELFTRTEQLLAELSPEIPNHQITPGHNTKQVISYGYTSWDQMFNARQLLALSLLARGIAGLCASPERDALMMLFSGMLEFSNMFASYKGEGTGAVRHMFSHHILKPERTPLEANVWGTPYSSGSFSTLFKSRLLRAVDYKAAPFEVRVDRAGKRPKGKKVYGLSMPMGAAVLARVPPRGLPAGAVYLSCGDSAQTDLPDHSVDAVITDPPFFDNVHYSELADFFFAWQQLYFEDRQEHGGRTTTRHPQEVQDTDPVRFGNKLRAVFCECHRVLKDDGLLVFSYHHSREDGWLPVLEAVAGAGFRFIAAQPVKAEMSVAAPKTQAKSPIDLDVLLVCRKAVSDRRPRLAAAAALSLASSKARRQITRFARGARKLSENDVRVVLLSQALVACSAGRNVEQSRRCLRELLERLAETARELWSCQASMASIARSGGSTRADWKGQLSLL